MKFKKFCGGFTSPGIDWAIQAGAVEGLSGNQCDLKSYEGWFLEGNYGFGGRSGGCDVGFKSNRFHLPYSPSGVNECGGGVGTTGLSFMLCYYVRIE